MSPVDTYREWDEAKQRRRADPENEQLIREELEAEIRHLNRVGVEIHPPTWWREHKALVQGVGGTLVAIAFALLVLFAYETNQEQGNQGDELKVLVQSSPCAPTKDHPNSPRDPDACKRSFAQGVKNLTPEQSCFILERGAPLIKIGGKPIPLVTCRRGKNPPPRPRKNQLEPSGQAPDAESAAKGEQAAGEAPGTAGGGATKAPAGGGGKAPQGKQEDTPNPNPAPKEEGGSGEESAPTSQAPPAEASGGGEPAPQKEVPPGASKVGEVVDTVGSTVGDAVKGLCTAADRLAGVCH